MIEHDLADALADMEARKDNAYLERNRLVAMLASLFPSVRCKTDIPGWSPDWHGCVYITLPTGQASWHYHDSHEHLFAHVPIGEAVWDGHTTEEKYVRVAQTRSPILTMRYEPGDVFLLCMKEWINTDTHSRINEMWKTIWKHAGYDKEPPLITLVNGSTLQIVRKSDPVKPLNEELG